MRRTLTRTALFAVAMSCTRSARAEEGCDANSKRPWVAVAYDASLGAADADRVRRELRADLAPQAIDVCDATREGTPIARIELSPAPAAHAVSIRLEIRDAITAKDVARTLSTENIPADGRALAIAVAAAELLRASWAELALRSAPPPAMPVPPPVMRIVEVSIAPEPVAPPPRIIGLGVAFATEAFTTGFVRMGADVRASVDLGAFFTTTARVGFRRALPVASADGRVDADALVFGGEGSVSLLARSSRWNLDLLARVDVAEISFHATPATGVAASAATLTSVEAGAGVRAHVRLTPSFGLSIEAGAGGPIVSATARDGDAVIAGTNGALVFAGASANGKF